MNRNPHSYSPKSSEELFQRSGAHYNIKDEMKLEYDVQQAHMGVMVSCAQIFVNIMYVRCS